MTLIDTTERQTSEDVVFKAESGSLRAFSGGRLCYPLLVFVGRLPLHLTRLRW